MFHVAIYRNKVHQWVLSALNNTTRALNDTSRTFSDVRTVLALHHSFAINFRPYFEIQMEGQIRT